jgi:hypothetical protein
LTKIYKGLHQFIQKYLLQYKHISVAGWGSMRLENTSAQLDFPNRSLHAGSFQIRFDEKAEADTAFPNWLADELKISLFEASNKMFSGLKKAWRMVS